MRLLLSLLLTLLIVGSGYWIVSRYFHTPEPVTITEAPHPPAANPPQPKSEPRPEPPATPPPASPAPAVLPPVAQWTAVEKRVLELTNEARRKARLNPLVAEDVLHQCAVIQSTDMLERNFFDHVNPSGEDPGDRVARIHRSLIGTAGENIWRASGSIYPDNPDLAQIIFDSWMHSPHHRENILRSEFTHLGVGVITRGNEVRATQSFANVRAYLTTPLPPSVPASTPVNLTTEGRPPAAELYALKPLHGAIPDPVPIEGATLRVPGNYRLELGFRTKGNGFSIFHGPSIVVSK
jgi:uncharacterized protein YkwD